MPLWAHISMGVGYAWIGTTMLTELPTFISNVLHYDITRVSKNWYFNYSCICTYIQHSIYISCISWMWHSNSWFCVKHSSFCTCLGSKSIKLILEKQFYTTNIRVRNLHDTYISVLVSILQICFVNAFNIFLILLYDATKCSAILGIHYQIKENWILNVCVFPSEKRVFDTKSNQQYRPPRV